MPLLLAGLLALQEKDSSPVILQGFYWDYPQDWYGRLTSDAPRLREIGITAVWTPPPSKGAGGRGDVGYGVFDHYDLGDKWQRGTVATRGGTRDEFLRMIATMHANGVDVILDVVLNQCIGAEVKDEHGWKTFRYRSFAGEKSGRWPKDWTQFHPNPAHDSKDGDIAAEMFGPDLCYAGRAAREAAVAWIAWLRKITDCDGFRLDAVKHFEPEVLIEALRATKPRFAIGEYVGSEAEIDAWSKKVGAGAFDFPFRGRLKGIVDGQGFFNLGELAAAPRYAFVNNHDTYRPTYDGQGRITGWGQEMGGHIHPDDPRADVAYAAAFALGGVPVVFYEDLFDHATGEPRKWMLDLLRAYRDFDCGAAKPVIRHASEDVLVVERGGVIFAMNDNGVEDKKFKDLVVPKTSFVIQVSRKAAKRTRAGRKTTHEFEMDDDLGDAHANSPGYGGRVGGDWRTVARVFAAKVDVATEPSLDVDAGKPVDGWTTIRVRRTVGEPARARVRVTYQP